MFNGKTFFSGLFIFLLSVGLAPQYVCGADKANLTHDERLTIGKNIYRYGTLADGKPARATVMGDIEVSGTQFTCINCHRRSGMGGAEGTKLVLPTNGPSLYEPRKNLYLGRPAYTDETLIEALALGVSPLGDPFDPAMPLYDLPDFEMDSLVTYLRTLSSEYSPGLDEHSIHIATVVDASLAQEKKEAMLTVINRYFAVKNGRSRLEGRRKDSGPFYHNYRNKAYRQWVLHVWELKGPRESWPVQLEEYYKKKPVFAMLSGMVNGSWQPIHQFSEKNRIPCLLPNTDLPVIPQEANFYTLYYSKGLTLEAEVILEDIEKNGVPQNILQVYRKDSVAMQAAQILNRLRDNNSTTVHDFSFTDMTGIPDWSALREAARHYDADAVVLWLSAAELQAIKSEEDDPLKGLRAYLSSTLLQGKKNIIPGQLTKNGLLVHPYNLPEDEDKRHRRLKEWLKVRKVDMTYPLIQGQTYYACLLLTEGLMHIRLYFYRDYLMDMIDHSQRMEPYVINYPRISFGPEQRYLAKGAYIINLQNNQADWKVPYR